MIEMDDLLPPPPCFAGCFFLLLAILSTACHFFSLLLLLLLLLLLPTLKHHKGSSPQTHTTYVQPLAGQEGNQVKRECTPQDATPCPRPFLAMPILLPI